MSKAAKNSVVVEKKKRVARVLVSFEALIDLDTAYAESDPKDSDLDEDLASLREEVEMTAAGFGEVVGGLDGVKITVLSAPGKVGEPSESPAVNAVGAAGKS